MKYLYNSKVRCYNGQNIFRLCLKLTPSEWEEVRQYFKYYDFEGIKGWGTLHSYDVAKKLLSLRSDDFKMLENERQQLAYDIRNANGNLEAEELSAKKFSVERKQSSLIGACIQY